MKPLIPLTIAASLLAGALSAPAAVLLRDTFDAATGNTTDLNVDIARQTGALAPITYTLASGPGHYGHQLQNVNAPNQLLVADFPNSTSSLNFNFNGANSAGGLKISFDVDSIPTVYAAGADNWGCINLGAAQADQLVNVNGGQTHFGILFRGAGTLQAFDGGAVVSPSAEPVYSTQPPGTTNHIDLVITDADGNPFDGIGTTIIEVFANGGALPVWTFTKAGGYANNYINVQGSHRAHIDNLTIEQLPADRAPVIANPSFEADTFTVFPGYVSGNGPITGWSALPGHGVNPGTFGGPFTDNGVIPDGTKAAFLQEDGPMTQVITGLSIGSTYQIRYGENARTGGTPGSEVKIGGLTIVAAHTVSPVGGANPYRDIISDPFTATSTSMLLSFIKSNPQGGDTTLLIDHVRFLAPGTPPSITAQPQDTIVALGDTGTLTVGAAGSAPLSYRWFFGANEIPGANAATLSIVATSGAATGDYSVIVANSSGSVTSRVAKVTVRAKVPGLFDTGVGDTGAALDDGAVDPHYQLVVNADSASTEALVHSSTIFPIVTGPWLANTPTSKWIAPRVDTTAAAGLAQGNGTYVYRITFDLTGLDRESVIITGGWAVDNNGVSIKVNDQVTGVVNGAGFASATPFTLTAANAAFSAGVNTLDFEVQNVDAVAGYTGLRVVNLRGTAQLPGTPPAIEQQPVGGLAGTGESFSFTVIASGSSPLSYQWQQNETDIPGANAATYTIASAQLSDAGDYRVRVTNPDGQILSSTVALQVRATVPGVFNTGVDDSGVALADGSVDPHYQIVVNPDSTSPDAIVENSGAFPIAPNGPWVANTDGSKWVGPRFDTTSAAGAVGVGGDYTYRTIVDLAGFDPATVRITGDWATDNAGVDIFINGQSTAQPNVTQFVGFTPFTISSGFVAGPNVIEFKLNNSAVGYTGLRVDRIRALGDALPAGTAPFIVTQPQSTTVVVGQTASFTVGANGSAPLTYQWYIGPDLIPGATSATYSFVVDFPDFAGDYSVEITNPFGNVRSSAATLTVLAEPVILAQPQSQVAAVGDSVTFTVSAIGEPPLTYQWARDGQAISGADQASYTIASVTAADVGSYTVEISNFSGSILSTAATLSIAELVPGLFNTGVDDAGVGLASGSVDPHYILAASADPAFPGPAAMVLNDAGFPIPPWLPNDDVSKWIAPQADQSAGNLEGDYIYRTTFSLTGFNPATIRVSGEWSSDNVGGDIVINGTSTGQANTGNFGAWTAFQIDTGFVSGVNTLEFKVNNAPPGVNPTGFRVRNIRALGVRQDLNRCPVAGSASYALDENSSITIPLNLFADPDGDPILRYAVVDAPDHGTVTPILEAGSGALLELRYTPAANYNGPDSFTYRVADASCDLDTATIGTITLTVRPANGAPTAAFTVAPLFAVLGLDYPTVLSANGSNACVNVDGSDSTDPDGDALTFAWLVNGGPTPVAEGVTSVVCLELGIHTITLVVTDTAGASGTTSKEIEVITAAEAVDVLIEAVNDADLDRKNKRPFLATLKAAQASFDRGNTTAAINQLNAFQNKVRAQLGRSHPVIAASWIRLAQAITNALQP